MQITPEQKDAVVKRAEPYPMQYCESLLDHMTNGTLSDRLLGFTNRPGSMTREEVPDSRLVMDTMRVVGDAIQDFIWPFCNVTATLISHIDALNVTLPWANSTREQGTLVIRYFENEAAIEEENQKYQANREAYQYGEMLGGVIFSEQFEYEDSFDFGINNNNIPKVPGLNYSLRLSPEFVNTNTDVLFPIFQLSGPGYDGKT